MRTGMDCFVTRNTKDYSNASVLVYQPSQFLEILNLS